MDGWASTLDPCTEATAPAMPQFRSATSLIPYPEGHTTPYDIECVGSYSNHGHAPSTLGTVRAMPNRDKGYVLSRFSGNSSQGLFIVCDGQGDAGAQVAEYCAEHFASNLADPEGPVAYSAKVDPSLIARLIQQAAVVTKEGVENEMDIDTVQSGSTMTSVLIAGDRIWCTNVGACQCVLGSANEQGEWSTTQLIQPHSLSRRCEMLRVLSAGGVVTRDLSTRVVVGERALALSRTFGHTEFSGAGVSGTAEVRHRLCQREDKFLVLATDGLWRVLDPTEVVQIVTRFYGVHANGYDGGQGDATAAARALIRIAKAKWQIKYPGYQDNITAVVIFLPLFKTKESLGHFGAQGLKGGETEGRRGSMLGQDEVASWTKELNMLLWDER